jgi:O-antigen/teichoic acid export membrane protein
MTPVGVPTNSMPSGLVSGLSWQFISVLLQGCAQLISLAVLARLLLPGDFGLIGAATVVVGIGALFSQLGFAPALVRIPSMTPRHLQAALVGMFGIGAAAAVTLYSVAPFIAVFFRMPDLENVLRATTVVFVVAPFGAVSEALLQRDMRFRDLMLVNALSYTAGFAAVAISLAAYGAGVWALVGGLIGQKLLEVLLLLRVRPLRFLWCVPVGEMIELGRFGVGFTLARFLNYMANEGDYVVVGRWLDAVSLGLYTRAYQLMLLPAKYLGRVLEKVMFPAMAAIQHDKARLSRLLLDGTAAVALVTVPTSVWMLVHADSIVRVALGEGWEAVTRPFIILCIGITFRTAYKLGDSVAKAAGAVYARSVREAGYAFLVIGGSIIGVRWGIAGVASAVLIAIAVNYVSAAHQALAIVGATWRQYFRVQVGGLTLGAIVLPVALITTYLLPQHTTASQLVSLIVSAALSATGCFVVVCRRPSVLGPEGERMTVILLSVLDRRTVRGAIMRERTATLQ